MVTDVLDRPQIAKGLSHIAEHLVEIAEAIDKELCKALTGECESDWETDRERVTKAFQKISPKHSISNRLPSNETGLIALEALSSLVRIGGAYQRIFFMIDMLRDVDFEAVFMDSLSSISRKVYESVVALKNMVDAFPDNPNAFTEGREVISKLEREVDEEHVIICRQISVATEGHPDYIIYLMRKIVGELEHITDHLQDFAETVEGF
ncbi:MAG: PhoU domain-containing protein [Candidatus Thorarchaeota archaeon]